MSSPHPGSMPRSQHKYDEDARRRVVDDRIAVTWTPREFASKVRAVVSGSGNRENPP